MYRAKSCTSVFLPGKFLFVRSDTFAVHTFSHETHRKKRVEENANVSFFETDNQACTGRVTFCYSQTDFVNFGQSLLSGLSLGAFINSTR